MTPPSPLLILSLAVLLLFGFQFFLFIRSRKISRNLEVFFGGKEGKDLEKILLGQVGEIKELDREIQDLFEISNQLRELCRKSLHKVNIVRFNPFKEVGGNQSFSVVLLDGKNSGVVLSSLHTREGTRVYAKPIASGKEQGFPFTEEEKLCIEQAINNKPTLAV